MHLKGLHLRIFGIIFKYKNNLNKIKFADIMKHVAIF